jgi:hypothetical protein
MYALNINNTTLDLPDGSGINVVLSCPLFDRDRVVRMVSFPFRLPLTPRNMNTLRFANRFDAQPRWGDVCTLVVEGSEYERGELVSTGDSNTEIEVLFRGLPITVVETLRKIYINEILETIEIPQSATLDIAQFTPVAFAGSHRIKIGGYIYTSTGIVTPSSTAYQFGTSTIFAGLINADFPGIASVSGVSLVISSADINEVGADWDELINMPLDLVTVGERSQLSYTEHVESVIATPVDTHLFPLMRWENFYEGKNTIWENVINPGFDGVTFKNVFNDLQEEFGFSFMPCVRVPYIIDRICAIAGIAYWAGYLKDDLDAGTLYVQNDRCSDRFFRDFNTENKFQYINGFEGSIYLNKHVPKMTAWDFLFSIATGMNVMIDFRDGGMHFEKALSRVLDAPVDYSKNVDVDGYVRTVKKAEGVKVLYVSDEAETFSFPTQLQPYEIAPALQRQEMPFRTLFMNVAVYGDYGGYRVPHSKRIGKSPALGKDVSGMGLYLAFDRGTGLTFFGNEYSYGSYDELGSDGVAVIGALSFELDGEFGLVAQNWGRMLEYPDYDELSVSGVLPVGEFYRLRLWKNARIRFYHPNGSVILILKSVDAKISARDDSGYIPVTLKGIIQK